MFILHLLSKFFRGISPRSGSTLVLVNLLPNQCFGLPPLSSLLQLPSSSIAIPSSAEMSSSLHQLSWYTHLPLGLSFYSSSGRYWCRLLVTTTLPSGQHSSWLPSCKFLRRCLQAPSSQVALSHPSILNGLWYATVQARIFLEEVWLSSSFSSWAGGEVWHNNTHPSH